MAPQPPSNPLPEIISWEIYSQAFALLKNHLSSLVMISVFPLLFSMLADMTLETLEMEPRQVVLAGLPLMVLVNGFLMNAFVKAVEEFHRERDPSLGEVYSKAFSGLGRVIWTYLAATFLTMMAFMPMVIPMVMSGGAGGGGMLSGLLMAVFMVPGLMVGGMLTPAVPIAALEQISPMAAIQRSLRLMRPRLPLGMAVFGFFVAVGAIIPLGVISVAGVGPYTPLLGVILQAVTMPLAFGANLYLYYRLRVHEPPVPSKP